MDSITVKDFRCFHDEQTARLAPLTLLVGENSTGKTSFMAMIRAIWDFAFLHRIPDFKEEPYDLGSFDEIANFSGVKEGGNSFEAGFNFTVNNVDAEEKSIFYFNATFEENGTVPVPTKRFFIDQSKMIWIENDLSKTGGESLKIGTSKGVWKPKDSNGFRVSLDDHIIPLNFLLDIMLDSSSNSTSNEKKYQRLIRLSGSSQPDETDLKHIREMAFILIGHYSERPYASAPVRSKPHRTYDPSRPTRVPEGDHIPMYLANLHFQDKEKWENIKKALETFGKASGLFDEISVKRLKNTAGGPFQIQVRKFGKKAKGPKHNLIDVGYGVNQVLPVITELLRHDNFVPPMFLFQQPEVHLHPSAQAALGSLFCGVAGEGQQIVVETHSDHLIDRVRMDIRDSITKLNPEDVSILYFEKNDMEVQIHSLGIDKEGNILNAPSGYRQFFLKEADRSYGLI